MEPLNKALKETADKLGLDKIFEAGQLVPKWETLVGPEIARKAQPTMIRRETLIVKTASPAWSHQLSMLKPQLLAKLRSAGFNLSDIAFQAAAGPADKPEKDAPEAIQAAPAYADVPPGVKPALRQAMAAFVGARSAAQDNKEDNKRPAKYDKMRRKHDTKTNQEDEL